MARAQGARAQLAAGFEQSYGTSPGSGAFWKMPFASTTLGTEQPLLSSELLGYGRDPLPPVKDAITSDGDVVVPIDSRFLGVWLKALMGPPSTTGTAAPYTHEFVTGKWDLPSMSIERGMPDVPTYAMFTGVKANQINWQMQRSGLVTATVGLIAQGETSAASSSAGSLTELSLARFGSFNGGVKRDGSQLANVVSASITYNNNLDRVETIRADGRIDGADPSIAGLTGDITVRFADTTLLDQAMNGAACELEFGYELSADESFKLVAHEVYLPRPRQQVQGPGGVQVTYNWQASDSQTAGQMATLTLVNDVETYSNPSSP